MSLNPFRVLSSQNCNQIPVNIIVGGWWSITLISSLCLLLRKNESVVQNDHTGENVLKEDQSSPVGYKVPSLPDFEIDLDREDTGSKYLSSQSVLLIGVILAIGAGTAMIAFSLTDSNKKSVQQFFIVS